LIVIVAAMLAGLVGMSSDAGASTTEAGRLQLKSDVAEVGEVVRGTDATGTFVLENVGGEPLKILGVKAACGCTVASFDPEIAPGGQGKVTATVKTEKFNGPIEKSVTVTTSDPANPTVVLKVKAKVVEGKDAAPRQVAERRD
jgi:hypothetical protein